MEDGDFLSLWGGKLDAYKFSITKPTSSIELGKLLFYNDILERGKASQTAFHEHNSIS